jgi:ACT domain-containing protein
MEIMRVMKNTKCQLLSIQEQLAIINTANATLNVPHKKSVKNFASVST